MAAPVASATGKKLYTRFVQIGRVVLIQFGPDAGKLATIVDVVDQNRILVDGPTKLTGVKRHVINVKWIALTDLSVPCTRNARQASLTKAWVSEDVISKWQASAWGKKVAGRVAKANLSDFQRFQAKVKKQAISKLVSAKVSSLKVAA